MEGRRPEMRRTMTLSEQLSTPDPAIDPAIRDFLKIPQDGLHEDGGGSGGMMGWKPLRDRLRLRRAAHAWHAATTAAHKAAGGAAAAAPPSTNTNSGLSNRSNKYNYSPGEAAAAFSRTYSRAPSLHATPTFSRVSSTRVGPSSTRSSSRRPSAAYEPQRIEDHADDHDDEEEDEEEEEEEEQGKEEAAPAAQMSLMALLEQTDSWDDDDDEEGGGDGGERKNGSVGDDDDDDGGEGREEEMVHVCCVCMVRHKGAAFIPCGHTFCRLCSRELWVSRGNCPLCNGFIQEILDIF